MAKFKPRLGVIKHQGAEHRSKEFAGAKGILIKIAAGLLSEYWYPETEQLNSRAGKQKLRIKYTPAMLMWLVAIQVSPAAATALLRIAAVLFNVDGNKFWIKRPWPAQNFIPLPPKLKSALQGWIALVNKHKPVAQGIACGGSQVRVIGESGAYWIIECFRPFAGKAPRQTPASHPWLFARYHEVDLASGRVRRGGLVWPYFSPTGKAYIHKSLVTL